MVWSQESWSHHLEPWLQLLERQVFLEVPVAMASELFASPAKLTLPHPQVAIEYASYSFRELLDGRCAGEISVFNDKQIL